jgi:uncharacterized membrane protein YhaH (DUF805 family)
MTWQTEFLGFKGRMARGRYWLTTLVLTVLIIAVVMLTSFLPDLLGWPLSDEAILVVFVVLSLVSIFPMVAVSTKRLHDRNKTGWWLAAMYVPPVISEVSLGETPESSFISLVFTLWALIELGFLRGTAGPNRFGVDPLAPQTERQ